MKITKEQLKQIIKEELEIFMEIEGDFKVPPLFANMPDVQKHFRDYYVNPQGSEESIDAATNVVSMTRDMKLTPEQQSEVDLMLDLIDEFYSNLEY